MLDFFYDGTWVISNQYIGECWQHDMWGFWIILNGIQCNLTPFSSLVIAYIHLMTNLYIINNVRRTTWNIVIHFKKWLRILMNNQRCCLPLVILNNVYSTLVGICDFTNHPNITFFFNTEAPEYQEQDTNPYNEYQTRYNWTYNSNKFRTIVHNKQINSFLQHWFTSKH